MKFQNKMISMKSIVQFSNLKQSIRSQSTKDAKKKVIPSKLYKNDELDDQKSYISTPHGKSMIRFFKMKKPDDETDSEREYRLKYEQVQLWNHNYWLKNNEEFQEVSHLI